MVVLWAVGREGGLWFLHSISSCTSLNSIHNQEGFVRLEEMEREIETLKSLSRTATGEYPEQELTMVSNLDLPCPIDQYYKLITTVK